jgi:hypothetical protein
LNFGVTTKLIATAFALCGFAVAVLAGLGAGNSSAQVLSTALISMMVCQAAGLGVGAVGERIVHEHMQRYRAGHPLSGAPASAEGQAQKSSPPEPPNS